MTFKTGWLETQEAALVGVEKRTNDTLMDILISIIVGTCLLQHFLFCCYYISLYGLFSSYKQPKDCAVSKMCHGTSMIELRIVKDTVNVTFVFCDLWQRPKRLAGSSRQVAGNQPPGFLTI